MKKYYSLVQNNNEADIYIYGDITSWPWAESDVSSYNLSRRLQELQDVDYINVYINSYGGEVGEGLAISNELKRHNAKIRTYADPFACSIASVIFSAGDERIVYDTSLLMIHNAWTTAAGNAKDFRKQADDLEKITKASINAYMNIVNITEEELRELLDNETWLNAEEALKMGFATSIIADSVSNKASQNVKRGLMTMIKQSEKEKLDQVVQETKEETQEEQQVEETQEEPKEQEKENKVLNLIAALYR
ncbi:head maturation protease, ClpP-related [Clostridium sp. UBA2485]|uniref:head maturation protease, ClpP-related n=1 Tax=Clostridium sp. UBA2485 TaxID=1946352 RepID=UPI0025BDD32E|nr:head maturation protease, ClpP-related [Clostridium sp. UBA2485]